MARPDQQQPETPQVQVDTDQPSQTPQNQYQVQVQTHIDQPSQTPESQYQVQFAQSETQPSQNPINKEQLLAIVAVVVRLTTWICLLVSLIVLASNTTTLRGVYRDVTVRFNDIYSYRYMMSAIVIGFAYTCLQLPFEMYHLSKGKPLTDKALHKHVFLGDKILLCLLATGVGAAFGATYDLKKNLDVLDDYLEQLGDLTLSKYRSKFDHFFNMGYVSAGFLLIAFLSSAASSIFSSLLLHKK